MQSTMCFAPALTNHVHSDFRGCEEMSQQLNPDGIEDVFESLFTVTFGFTFSFMLATALDVMWGGIDLAWSVSGLEFAVRLFIIGATLALCGVYFYHAYRYIKSFGKLNRMLVSYYEIIVTCFLSTGAWACYHLARVLAKPLSGGLYSWRHPVLNEDVLFLILFVPGVVLLVVGHSLVERLTEWRERSRK